MADQPDARPPQQPLDASPQQQPPVQQAKDEKRKSRKRRRTRRNLAFRKFWTIAIIGVVQLVIFYIMNNFDSVTGRELITVSEKYIHAEGKGYGIVCTEGNYYWLSKEDWDSCYVGEEIKLYTNRDGSSFIEIEGDNFLHRMFR